VNPTYLDPGNPAANQWNHSVVMDHSVTNYDIDGIHYDLHPLSRGSDAGYNAWRLCAFGRNSRRRNRLGRGRRIPAER